MVFQFSSLRKLGESKNELDFFYEEYLSSTALVPGPSAGQIFFVKDHDGVQKQKLCCWRIGGEEL